MSYPIHDWWPDEHKERVKAYNEAVERNTALADNIRINPNVVYAQHSPEIRASGNILISQKNMLAGIETVRLGYGVVLKVGDRVQSRLGIKAGDVLVYSAMFGMRFFGRFSSYKGLGWHEHESDEHRIFTCFTRKEGKKLHIYDAEALGLWSSSNGETAKLKSPLDLGGVMYRQGQEVLIVDDHYLNGNKVMVSLDGQSAWLSREALAI